MRKLIVREPFRSQVNALSNKIDAVNKRMNKDEKELGKLHAKIHALTAKIIDDLGVVAITAKLERHGKYILVEDKPPSVLGAFQSVITDLLSQCMDSGVCVSCQTEDDESHDRRCKVLQARALLNFDSGKVPTNTRIM